MFPKHRHGQSHSPSSLILAFMAWGPNLSLSEEIILQSRVCTLVTCLTIIALFSGGLIPCVIVFYVNLTSFLFHRTELVHEGENKT